MHTSIGISRVNAAIVGVLLIIGTATGIMAAVISSPILDSPDYLSRIAANQGTIISGSFLVFLMSIACAGVGLWLYPILSKFSIGLAISSAGFRLLESMAQVLSGLSFIALMALSREFINAGGSNAVHLQTVSEIIKASSDWINNGVVLIFWCISAFMYYGIFYRYRLVPRWISVWGLAGIILVTISSVLGMFGGFPGYETVQMIANLPIIPQEIVFAVWLIVKGINPPPAIRSASASLSAKSAMSEG
jgi:hypothetical protein